MRRTIIGGAACPPAMMSAFQDRYDVQVLHAWGMTGESRRNRVHAQAEAQALNDEARRAIQAKQGRSVYGIDMIIVGEDGRELPHDGKTSGS